MNRLWLSALMMAVGLPVTAQEPTRTVIDELIAARNPCAGLVTDIAGQRVGIDKLDAVELHTANASLQDNDITLSLSGRLACKTSGAALFNGNASASISADASVSLTDCDAASLEVQLSDFGGSFAAVLQVLKQVLELQIEESARPEVAKVCHGLRGDGWGPAR